jgi:hypothetical protein
VLNLIGSSRHTIAWTFVGKEEEKERNQTTTRNINQLIPQTVILLWHIVSAVCVQFDASRACLRTNLYFVLTLPVANVEAGTSE